MFSLCLEQRFVVRDVLYESGQVLAGELPLERPSTSASPSGRRSNAGIILWGRGKVRALSFEFRIPQLLVISPGHISDIPPAIGFLADRKGHDLALGLRGPGLKWCSPSGG